MGDESSSWWRDAEALGRFLDDLTAEGRAADAAGICEALCLAPRWAELLQAADPRHWRAIAAEALEAGTTHLTFRTSGSSGAPKACRHALARLEEEVDFLHDLLRGAHRVVALVPTHHIYGWLFALRLPQRLRVPAWDARGQRPDRLAAALRPGDLVIGFPEIWAALARHGGTLGPGIGGVTSTAPCPPETAAALQAKGLARLVNVHGSSETSGIGWRDTADGPFALFPAWTRGPTADVIVHGASGEAAKLPDHLDWLDERHFHPRGRRDGAVQVGGVNVFPARVEAVLLTHPRVAAADVRPMPTRNGLRLKAFIVPREPDDGLRSEIVAWLRERLQPPERPRALVIGPALPRGPMGKRADWPVQEEMLLTEFAAL